jgi:ferritin-like metal-binding protein YciE
MKLSPEKLRIYFISHLNKIYCAKSHLAERLPEIEEHSHFRDLKYAIAETLEDIQKQIVRMDEIYALLGTNGSIERCGGMIGMVEDAYAAIHEQMGDPMLRDLSILFYMQNIESVEMASFQVLRMAAVKFKNKQIKQLLLENFDEARSDRTLLLLITSKYITS